MKSNEIYEHVYSHYGSLACGIQPTYSDAIAQALGYSGEELKSIPAEANLGVSCGNPLAISSLREGETVIDFGSGAGFDVLLASKKVGASGQAIGVDMNKDMLARALRNKSMQPHADNVSFIEGKITAVPLGDSVADCIISNCVINLVPEDEKPRVFAEMARLLKPGGRVAVSDILARKPLPAMMRESVALYVGCIAGASTTEDYTRLLSEAGFCEIAIADAEVDLNVYTNSAKKMQAGQAAANCCNKATTGEDTLHVRNKELESPCAKHNVVGGAHVQAHDNVGQGCHASCCRKSGVVDKAGGNENMATVSYDFELANVNINEWVGSFKINAFKKQT